MNIYPGLLFEKEFFYQTSNNWTLCNAQLHDTHKQKTNFIIAAIADQMVYVGISKSFDIYDSYWQYIPKNVYVPTSIKNQFNFLFDYSVEEVKKILSR